MRTFKNYELLYDVTMVYEASFNYSHVALFNSRIFTKHKFQELYSSIEPSWVYNPAQNFIETELFSLVFGY